MILGHWKLNAIILMGILLILGDEVLAQNSSISGAIQAQSKEDEGKMKEKNCTETLKFKGNPKLDSSLNQLLEAYQEGGMARAQAFAVNRKIFFQEGRVQVTIVTTEESIGHVRDAVEAAGGLYQLHYRNFLQAMVPIEALEVLAQRPDVIAIREPHRAMPL
jgi:hypothetical protein